MTVTFITISMTITIFLGTIFPARDAFCAIEHDRSSLLNEGQRPPPYDTPPAYSGGNFDSDVLSSALAQNTAPHPSVGGGIGEAQATMHNHNQMPHPAPLTPLPMRHQSQGQDPTRIEEQGLNAWNQTPPPEYTEQVFMFGHNIDMSPPKAPASVEPSLAPSSANEPSHASSSQTTYISRGVTNGSTDNPTLSPNFSHPSRVRSESLPTPLSLEGSLKRTPSSSSFGSQDFGHLVLQKDNGSPKDETTALLGSTTPSRFSRRFSDTTPSRDNDSLSPSLSRALFARHYSNLSRSSSQNNSRSSSPFDVLGSFSHLGNGSGDGPESVR